MDFMRTVGCVLTAPKSRQISSSLFISFSIHFFLFLFLTINPPLRRIESVRTPVRIFLTNRLSISDGESKKVKESLEKPVAKVQPDHAAVRHEVLKNPARSSVIRKEYGKLLPRVDQLIDASENYDEPAESLARITVHDSATKMKTGRNFGLKGDRLSPEHEKWMDELGSNFIVPTSWRKSSDEGYAIAIIRREGPGALWLDSLHGNPFLRAVVFHYLGQERIISMIDRDLRQLTITEFKIILRFVKQHQRLHGLNAQTSAFTDGLVITKELPPEMLDFVGIPISDKEVERGRLIEKM